RRLVRKSIRRIANLRDGTAPPCAWSRTPGPGSHGHPDLGVRFTSVRAAAKNDWSIHRGRCRRAHVLLGASPALPTRDKCGTAVQHERVHGPALIATKRSLGE